MIWVHAGQVHRWGRLDQIEGTVIMFAASAVDSSTDDILHRSGAMARNHWRNMVVPNSIVAETLDLLVAHARRRLATDSPDTIAVTDALLRTTTAGLLLSLVADHPDSPPATSTDERLLTFRAEVGRHFAHDRSVASYARRLGYSERTLHRLVINGTGRSPKQIIDERVILEAKRLLVHGGLPMDTIARSLGFDDQSNFTKFFKKSVGSGPRDFRAANS